MPYTLTAHAKDIFHESVEPADLAVKWLAEQGVKDAELVIAAPSVPIPKIPSAVPVRSLGYQRET